MSTMARQDSRTKLPLSLRLLNSRRRGRPAARYAVEYEPGIVVPGADGSALLTDRYLPVTGETCPTVLVRSPYGRGFPWNYLFGVFFAEQGFHVVVQSCRGTGGSGGELHPWHNDVADGQALVEWLREQDWFSGRFGTLGPSYLGYAQWALAVDPPPEWRAAVIQVGVHDPYSFFYPSGAFGLERALVGGIGLLTQEKGPLRFALAAMRLQRQHRRVEQRLPLIDAYRLAFGERQPYFEDWLNHPAADDPFWTDADVGGTADRLAVPVSLVGGWHDVQLDQTLQQYGRLWRAGRDPSLLVGPWTHTSPFDKGWPHVFEDALAWLRAHLSDDPSGLRPTAVRVHVGGRDEWRDLPAWPPHHTDRRYYLHADQRLAGHAPSGEPASTRLHYDPAAPTPSVGGPLMSRGAGYRDNTTLEARDDVLLFTTDALETELEVIGEVRAELHVSTSNEHADLFVRLCDVDARGRSTNVCDGLVRLRPRRDPEPGLESGGTGSADGTRVVAVAMSATAYRFAAGHRLRLQVSGGAHPRFARNTGTAEPVATATTLVAVDTVVHHDAAHPSSLTLPVPLGVPESSP